MVALAHQRPAPGVPWPASAPPPPPAHWSCSSTNRGSSPTTRSAIRTCASSPSGCPRSTTRARAAAAGAASRCSTTSSASPGRASRTSNWKPFGDNVPERVARLIHERKMGPAIIVFPDCFTALGGNQYVNSSAIGNYADYLTREIVPFVDREFRTLASREHRGCFGKSSGGYGAIDPRHEVRAALGRDRQPLRRRLLRLRLPLRLAEHARRARAATASPSSAPARSRCRRRPRRGAKASPPASTTAASPASSTPCGGRKSSPSAEGHAIMNLCMAATYDPDPAAPHGFRLPFNSRPGS